MSTYGRVPLKAYSKRDFTSAGYSSDRSLQAAADRQRARSSAFHAGRMTAVPRLLAADSMAYGRSSLSSTEVKSFDCVVANSANLVDITGPPVFSEPGAAFAGFTCVNEVQQGAAFYNRIGSKVMIKSIQLRGTLECDAAIQGVVRLILVHDKQTNAAAPAFTDLLLNQPANAANFHSGLNIANKSRFSIIRDTYFLYDAAQSLAHNFNIYCKGRWGTEYKASAATIGDISTGSLLVFMFKSAQIGVGNLIARDITTRIRYYD